MAAALQCDRCNRVYAYPKTLRTIDHYIVMVVRPYSTNKTLDLCPECTKKLNKFMNDDKEQNNG